MLEARDLACSRGDRSLFSNLDFSLAQGSLLRVAGANGSGKTSLLRILCGLRSPNAGEVRWSGRGIAEAGTREEFHRELVYIGHHNGLKDEFTPVENLAAAAQLAGMPDSREAVLAALERLGLAHCARLPLGLLSQGQKRRAALGRLLLGAGRPLWILDEPFNALDAPAVRLVEGLLAAHAAAGGLAVFTSHLDPDTGDAPLFRVEVGTERPAP